MPSAPPITRRRWLRCAAIGTSIGTAAALGLRELAFRGPIVPVEPLPASPIVDLHAHAAGLSEPNFVSPALRDSYKFDAYLRAFRVSAEELAQHGDTLLIDRMAQLVSASQYVQSAVVLALDGAVDDHGDIAWDRTEVYLDNDFVAQAVARHPALLFGASIHPRRRDALDRLDRAIEAGAKLVKWIPPIQAIDPADSRHDPFYRRMAASGLPLLTHGGQERSFLHSDDRLGAPERLERALDLGVTVIIAHAAAHGGDENGPFLPRLADLARRYKNVYADISALTLVHRHGQLEQVLREPALTGRLLYGSDHPLDDTALCSPWYHPLQLRWTQMREIAAIDNPWDRDVRLKQALGVPAEVFAAPARVLGLV